MDEKPGRFYVSHLEEENARLKISVQELSILNEIAAAISSALSLDRIIELIVSKCVKHLHVEQCYVTLLEQKPDSSDFKTIIRKADVTSYNTALRVDSQFAGWMILNKKPITVNNTSNDTRFNFDNFQRSEIKSFICAPLMMKGQLIGMISVFNKKENKSFTAEDERLLYIIASQSAHVIENARLLEDEKKLIAFQEEIKHAAEIQKNLLPKELPQLNAYDISAINTPAKEVGGDYFDFIKMDESHTAFCLGDVSGKGMPAALLMANLQATLRGQTFLKASCSQCISFANNLLYVNTDSSKYATLFYGILNTENHKICYCNAGHNPPLLFGNDGVKKLESGGVVVGIIPNNIYHEDCITLNVNDVLILYSDGITEAMNITLEEFGDERLISLISSNKDKSSKEILNAVLSSVNNFAKGVEQSDDITMVVIKRIN